jgi:NAD(P)H-hydrate repair Nnr-like enzyme with NAD(P)H-hydrate dehydratase domain
MLLIAGTIPIEKLPLTIGTANWDNEFLVVDGSKIPCTQGTAAMISAALVTTNYLEIEPPQVIVVGDIGQGKGSRHMYEYLIEKISEISPDVLALHYCLPDMALTRRLCEAVKHCSKRPVMIADAASMYAAKAAGLASEFDLFTPDATEMAFLADPEATHPAYIAKHLFDTDITKTPELVIQAYKQKSAAKSLLVKGATDYIVENGETIERISEPNVPPLEAIGGTGDTITGVVSALTYAELVPQEAAIIAARANRMAGQLAQATPATRVWQIVNQFPYVFKEHLCALTSRCSI